MQNKTELKLKLKPMIDTSTNISVSIWTCFRINCLTFSFKLYKLLFGDNSFTHVFFWNWSALDPQIAQLLLKHDLFATSILLVFLDFLEHFHYQSQHSTVHLLLEPFYIYFPSSVICSIKRLDKIFCCFCCRGFG